ncbi:hypothetical protein KCU81_g9992, partial [Aureobasidium melanogenum]|uniref:Uncharacterized protein n=1 Tax=Aureobasidium melanogenum (strain CBS 110374) TaxID=1043003 RepID=A0A074VIZ6_AURM1
MSYHSQFTLPTADQHDVDATWFDKQRQLPVEKNDSRLRTWLVEQVNALQDFYDGDTNPDAVAAIMTHSISTSSILDLGSYSDDILALNILWRLLIKALIEWPSPRTHDLFALLDAKAQVPDKIHKGEASDEDGTPWTWSEFPYFSLIWPEHFQPGQICRRCSDGQEIVLARRLYLRIKDLEAQLIAKRVMGMGRWRTQYIILALEKSIDDSDRQIAINDAVGYEQVKLDFHIPTISFLFRYNAREIYGRVVHGDVKDMTPARRWPGVAKEFETGQNVGLPGNEDSRSWLEGK